MSRFLEDTDVISIMVLLSPERLAALTQLTGSERTAIELHQEALRIGTNLMNVIAYVELALRNTVSENLTAFFGTSSWLTHPPAPFQWRPSDNSKIGTALANARRAEYAKMSQAEKAALDAQAFPHGRPPNISHLQRARNRQQQIMVSEGKVIAEMTFHFWKRIYSSDYEQILWRTTLKRTFPNKNINRAQVAKNFEHIYQARNRLAHHEPVLYKRFLNTITAIEFVIQNLGVVSSRPDTPLAKLISSDLEQVSTSAQALHERLDSFRV